MLTAPPVPMVTVTRFGVTVRGPKFRLEAVGRLMVPNGYTVRRLLAVPLTSVTLRTIAVAPLGMGSTPTGSPATPVNCTFSVAPGPNAGLVKHWMHVEPGRVSRIRNGLSGK